MPKYKDVSINLRNQDKIKSTLGDKALSRITGSILSAINSNNDIEPLKIDGSKYDVIIIDDRLNNDSMIAFYIIKSTFKIYNIAFKEFIKKLNNTNL